MLKIWIIEISRTDVSKLLKLPKKD